MTPVAMQRKLERFFHRYAERFQRALDDPGGVDSEGVAASFADYFSESGPEGVHGGKNGLKLKFMMKRGFARYRKIGTRSMKVARIRVTPLDDRHAIAKVAWDSRYRRRKDGAHVRIAFENLYFVRFLRGVPKIFAYIVGDERALLKKNGLA